MPDFVHLHLHSEYSMLDGLNIINPRHKTHALIEKAKALGMKALAITDHGAMYGALHFYNARWDQADYWSRNLCGSSIAF